MVDEIHQREPTFSKREALVGFFAYVVVALIILSVYFL